RPCIPTLPRPLRPTLFPYTTLFRSVDISRLAHSLRQNAATVVLVHTDGRRQFLHSKGAGEDAFLEGIRLDADIVGDATHFHQGRDRKSTRLNSSHVKISYAVFCLKK